MTRAERIEEALRDLAARCRDLDALIGDQGAGVYLGWRRAIDAADAALEERSS